MTLYLIITALTVSIDSFVCGFSLALKNNRKIPIIIGIALTVLVMCSITNYATVLLSEYLDEKTASLGGLILIGVGLFNLFKKKTTDDYNTDKNTIILTLVTGFAVGLDGAIANLSLALMGLNDFYVPLTIAVCHAITIAFGVILAQTKISKKLAKIEFVPPLILILLGGYKLLGLFI
ncbi:MAG: manganese efflux pump [Clostridia bacterium]|nr:manganese efflux pump [Clostridia bacterium]